MSTVLSTNHQFDYPKQDFEVCTDNPAEPATQFVTTLRKARENIQQSLMEGKRLSEEHHPSCSD